jgi:hypothetical protein
MSRKNGRVAVSNIVIYAINQISMKSDVVDYVL